MVNHDRINSIRNGGIALSLSDPVCRIFQPGRAHLQLTEGRNAFHYRFIGNHSGYTGQYPGKGETPIVTINAVETPYDNFVREYEIFSKPSGDYSWKGVTIVSINMTVESRSGPEDCHLNGPLTVTLNWEHQGKIDEIILKTSYGKIM